MTTRTKKFWTGWALLASTTLAACGGGAKGTSAGYPGLPGAPARGTASYGYAESSASKAESQSAGASIAPSDAAPSATSRSEESSAPSAPSERPGLGTEWGETRYSHVTQTEFRRADPNQPAEVASIYYNDREGARAMTRFQDYRELGSAVVNLPWLGVTVSLNDEGGSPLPSFYAGGHTYAVGEVGHRYTINVSNHESSPVEVVASVDGLDVLDGKNASYAKRGYLVPPGGSMEIDGFRQSDDNVAAFRFGSVRDSYAARTGSSRNVGIIGVAVFPERGETWTEREIERRKSADPFPGAHRPGPYASPPPRW